MIRTTTFALCLAALTASMACSSATGPVFSDGQTIKPGQGMDGWTAQPVRDEISPRFFLTYQDGATWLGLDSGDNFAANGWWTKTLPIDGGQEYEFSAQYKAIGVATPDRSIFARVVWTSQTATIWNRGEYPLVQREPSADGWTSVRCAYRALGEADHVRLELCLRWAPNGQVIWRNVEFKKAAMPAKRLVRLGALHHRPPNGGDPRKNVELLAKDVENAAEMKLDLLCLPEGITMVGTDKTYVGAAEPIPGPSTERLGQAAAKANCYVVAGLYERDGKTVYNTSVLIDRQGKLVGKYRKICLPEAEVDGGITPGEQYPVFDTDFGRVAMIICWDHAFPEVAREFTRRGAEVLACPIWDYYDELMQARAIENQVYLLASSYGSKTGLFNLDGKMLCQTQKDGEIVVSEVDLNRRGTMPGQGWWRARLFREVPPK